MTGEYYKLNGLDPLTAFEEGLISREELKGFIKGNIIKYITRVDDKHDTFQGKCSDLQKILDYTWEYYAILVSEHVDCSMEFAHDLIDMACRLSKEYRE